VAFAETLESAGGRLGFFGFRLQLFVTSPVIFADRLGLLSIGRGRGPRAATSSSADEAEEQEEPHRLDEPRALHEFLAPY
jgi:hypothetical protein